MARAEREQEIEFECETGDDRCPYTRDGDRWMVAGRFNAEGTFEIEGDDMGSDADCPECGEKGHPADDSISFMVLG